MKEKKKEKKICKECGGEIEGDFVEYDGGYICQDCFDENYFYCDDCGEIFNRDYSNYIDGEDKLVCDDCLYYNYTQCADCGYYYPNGYGYSINNGHGDYYDVCESCFNNNDYYCCDDCGDHFHSDDLNYIEDGDSYYCHNCYSRHTQTDRLYDYHEFRDWQLFDCGENPSYYIGKEIELEPKENENKKGVLDAIKNNINAVGMYDGSLKYGGVEVVTHPESWEYLQAHKQDYINFFNEINGLNYGNNGGCGLHFHVSRPNDNVTSRVIVLLESFKDEITKLSRREKNKLNQWAKFITDNCSDSNKVKYQSTKYLKEKYIKDWHERYYALNLCNSKTIEFRFFNGVNTFEQYWAALQFIHNIMELALDEEKPINTINWQDLLQGDELREQARKRDVLEINRFAKDTTEILEKLEMYSKKAKEDIKKTLGKLAKYVNKELSEYDLKDIKTNNVGEMLTKISEFQTRLNYKKNYLERVVNLYNALDRDGDGLEMDTIKDYWNSTKQSYPNNSQRYTRYGKEIEKAIKNYESEVK